MARRTFPEAAADTALNLTRMTDYHTANQAVPDLAIIANAQSLADLGQLLVELEARIAALEP
jgi:hypothetical protein